MRLLLAATLASLALAPACATTAFMTAEERAEEYRLERHRYVADFEVSGAPLPDNIASAIRRGDAIPGMWLSQVVIAWNDYALVDRNRTTTARGTRTQAVFSQRRGSDRRYVYLNDRGYVTTVQD